MRPRSPRGRQHPCNNRVGVLADGFLLGGGHRWQLVGRRQILQCVSNFGEKLAWVVAHLRHDAKQCREHELGSHIGAHDADVRVGAHAFRPSSRGGRLELFWGLLHRHELAGAPVPLRPSLGVANLALTWDRLFTMPYERCRPPELTAILSFLWQQGALPLSGALFLKLSSDALKLSDVGCHHRLFPKWHAFLLLY
jgi:hypothetical protein